MPVTKNYARLLVVGGNGFIGRHVVKRAIDEGWNVTSLNLSPHSFDKPNEIPFRSLSANIADATATREVLNKEAYEYVVNCGGYIDHSSFFDGGRETLDVHFQGVLNLVSNLNRKVLKSFVNIGSSDEYGNGPAPQSESQREMPIAPYSLGKVAATHFLQMLYRTERFPAVTLRLFLTYGPGQDERRFLPQVIKGCLEAKTFPTSLGEQRRDFCYVDDIVNAIFLALSEPSAIGRVINVASGKPITIRQVVETVRLQIGSGKPQYGAISYRPGESMDLYADRSLASQLLRWEPKVDLERGVKDTIAWIRGRL